MTERIIAPRQQRSRDSLSRILAAVEQLLQEGGLEQVTVAEICRRADCSVGSFYARFPEREAVFDHLHGQICARARNFSTQMLDPARWNGAELDGILRRYLRLLLRNSIKNRGLLRASLLLEQGPWSETFSERRRELDHKAVQLTTRLFESRWQQVEGDPTEAARLFQRAVRAWLIGEVLFAHPVRGEEELFSDLYGLVLRRQNW